MPDLSEVEAAMVDIIVATLYPRGPGQDSTLGQPCRVYRGWPTPTSLNTDLVAGVVNITVAPDKDIGRTTTRFDLRWTTTPADQTLSASVTGTAVTITGTPTVGQSVGILADQHAYVYQVRPGDSSAGIAANLAAMIRSTRFVHLSNNRLEVPNAFQLIARTVTAGKAFREARRQERDLRVMAWCPGPESRDRAATVVDHAFAATPFLITPGEIRSRIVYKGTSVYDQALNSHLYPRNLIYTVEYPTILVDDLPAMLFGDLGLNVIRVVA